LVKVIKRNGREEDFVYEKVVVSCIKSGAPVDVAREIAKRIEKKIHDNTTTKEIRKLVLDALRENNAELAKNWLTYDRAVKKRKD